MKVDVLVVVPPQGRPMIRRLISKSYPATTSMVDSVPLRLCGVLERDGYTVGYLPLVNYLLDFSIYRESDKEIAASFLKEYEFDCLIQSTDYHISSRSTPWYPSMLLLSSLAKRQNPNAKVILAGKHVSFRPFDPFEKSKDVDVTAVLECEPHISELVETLLKECPPENIPAIVYKTNGRIKRNKGYGIVKDLDWLPPPSYHLLAPHCEKFKKWTHHPANYTGLLLRTSYGCVFNCAFCSHTEHYNVYRMRSAENVKEDVLCSKKLPPNVSLAYFEDELMSKNAQHVHAIANVMEELDTKIMGALTSVRAFNKEIAKDLSRMCSAVLFGAENANKTVLETIKKGIDLSRTIKACKIAQEHSLGVKLFWMVGLPGEDKRTMVENLNAMHSLIMKGLVHGIHAAPFVPYPGSAISQTPQEYGVTIHHEQWEDYDEGGGYPVHSTRDLTREDIYEYYLLAQMVINEASAFQQVYKARNVCIDPLPGDPELFEHILNSRGT